MAMAEPIEQFALAQLVDSQPEHACRARTRRAPRSPQARTARRTWPEVAGTDDLLDELVFQVDLAPRQARRFELVAGQRPAPRREDYKVYGRFVRERHDDFAWENDRIAHRAYGTDLETWRKEPLTSSGIDV